jgi:uncharacterized protein (TIGR03382 family)
VGPCDHAEVCDGVAGSCPLDTFLPSTQVCNALVTDVCDAPDHCTGSTGDCPAEYASGVSCRPAAGACDVAESCSGTSASCPPDDVLAAGVTCRPSSMGCDPTETCDGVATSCPVDTSSCDDSGLTTDAGSVVDAGATTDAAVSDAGRADGSVSDVGTAADAGAPPPVVGACGCAAAGRGGPSFGSLAALLLAALSCRRRFARARTRPIVAA